MVSSWLQLILLHAPLTVTLLIDVMGLVCCWYVAVMANAEPLEATTDALGVSKTNVAFSGNMISIWPSLNWK